MTPADRTALERELEASKAFLDGACAELEGYTRALAFLACLEIDEGREREEYARASDLARDAVQNVRYYRQQVWRLERDLAAPCIEAAT